MFTKILKTGLYVRKNNNSLILYDTHYGNCGNCGLSGNRNIKNIRPHNQIDRPNFYQPLLDSAYGPVNVHTILLLCDPDMQQTTNIHYLIYAIPYPYQKKIFKKKFKNNNILYSNILQQ